jgi:hypothetical protein
LVLRSQACRSGGRSVDISILAVGFCYRFHSFRFSMPQRVGQRRSNHIKYFINIQ